MKEDGDTDRQRAPRILIVDDEEHVRSLLRDVLSSDGYEMHEADDGSAARDLLERTDVDVVITDLLMPDLGGLALMQWAQENRPGSMWIILSGRGDFDDAVRAVRLGAFDFITKPIDTAESLRVTVRNAVEHGRLAAERRRLTDDLAERNRRLRARVAQLQEAVGLLCDQAETIGQDLRRAELIQRALLPYEAPSMGRYAVNAVYRPSHNVGGDLYEVVRVDDRYAIAYIADAAGHGVSAAMLAVLFKHRIGTLDERRVPHAPADVLAAANERLLAECEAPGLFITVAYCLLDMQSGELVAASAGHTPILHRRADGSVTRLHHTGPALGLAPSARFAQERLALAPGDRLLLYTDGLCDAPERERGLTAEQIADILRADGAGDGQALLARLLAVAAERRGQAPQEDDVTMVLLKADASPSALDNGTPAPVPAAQPTGLWPTAQVLMGRSQNACAFSIEGRATWKYCATFHDACAAEIDAGRELTLDLSLCTHMDSTFLGTLQEMTQRADRAEVPLRLQGVLPEIGELFAELGMEQVASHVSLQMQPLPNDMAPLGTYVEEDDRARKRMLLAHEALASLNDRNREEFLRLVECLRREIDDAPPSTAPG